MLSFQRIQQTYRLDSYSEESYKLLCSILNFEIKDDLYPTPLELFHIDNIARLNKNYISFQRNRISLKTHPDRQLNDVSEAKKNEVQKLVNHLYEKLQDPQFQSMFQTELQEQSKSKKFSNPIPNPAGLEAPINSYAFSKIIPLALIKGEYFIEQIMSDYKFDKAAINLEEFENCLFNLLSYRDQPAAIIKLFELQQYNEKFSNCYYEIDEDYVHHNMRYYYKLKEHLSSTTLGEIKRIDTNRILLLLALLQHEKTRPLITNVIIKLRDRLRILENLKSGKSSFHGRYKNDDGDVRFVYVDKIDTYLWAPGWAPSASDGLIEKELRDIERKYLNNVFANPYEAAEYIYNNPSEISEYSLPTQTPEKIIALWSKITHFNHKEQKILYKDLTKVIFNSQTLPNRFVNRDDKLQLLLVAETAAQLYLEAKADQKPSWYRLFGHRSNDREQIEQLKNNLIRITLKIKVYDDLNKAEVDNAIEQIKYCYHHSHKELNSFKGYMNNLDNPTHKATPPFEFLSLLSTDKTEVSNLMGGMHG